MALSGMDVGGTSLGFGMLAQLGCAVDLTQPSHAESHRLPPLGAQAGHFGGSVLPPVNVRVAR